MHTLLTWTSPLVPASDSANIHFSGRPAPLFHLCPAGHLFLIPPWPGEPGPAEEGYSIEPLISFVWTRARVPHAGSADAALGLSWWVRCGAAVRAAGLASNC